MRIFLTTLLLSIGVLFQPSFSLAQEATDSSLLTPTPPVGNTYSLPYPGMLPDNPLYPLKMMRDAVIRFLITDTYKKAQFNLLQADKRLQAGVFLLQKDTKKTELALSTIAKGENYFSQAIAEAALADSEGRDIKALVGVFEQSLQKHRQIITNLKATLPQEKTTIENLLRQISTHEKQIRQLKKR